MRIFFNTAAGGHRLIDNVNLVPEFIGKVTLNPTPVVGNEGGELDYLVHRYDGRMPATNGRPFMLFWTLPVSAADIWWWPQEQYGSPGASWEFTSILAYFSASTTPPPVLPEAYVFSLGPVEISSAPMAARLWDTAGRLLFDSGKVHLALQQVAAGIEMGGLESTHDLLPLPVKPAFLFPSVYRHREAYDRGRQLADYTRWLGCYRRTGNSMTTRVVEVINAQRVPHQSLSYFQDQTYGNTNGLVLPVIDASLYE